jgi:hypothetical protein
LARKAKIAATRRPVSAASWSRSGNGLGTSRVSFPRPTRMVTAMIRVARSLAEVTGDVVRQAAKQPGARRGRE